MDSTRMGCVVAQTSASHTFGNVTAQVQRYLLEQFPAGTFKTIHVHTKLAHRQLASTPKEFLKKTKPMFIMKPHIDWDDNETFLKGTLLTETWMDNYHTWGDGNLQGFISDPKRDFYVKWLLDRTAMNFDIMLVFATPMEQINWVNYIYNKMRVNHPFFIQTQLESYMSKDLMGVISTCAGVPIRDRSGSVKPFLDYLNSHSCYPVTYKLKGSTGTDEFFRYYAANIDTRITSMTADDGERAGVVAGQYVINMTVRAEFYHTGLYYVFSPICKPETISIPEGANIIPVYTDIIDHEDYRLDQGWKAVARASFKLDNSIHDTIDISTILNTSVKTGIRYHLDHGIPLYPFIDIRIRKQGDIIRQDEDYKVNYEDLTIDFFRGNPYQTYSMIVYVDVKYLNDLIKDVCHLE